MDGELKKIHPHQALAMSRQQALETLRDLGDDVDKHKAALLLAGPQLTEQDEIDLMKFRPEPKRTAVCVRLAILRGVLCAA